MSATHGTTSWDCRARDLVYDIARHVDSAVHMFEEWGLPFFKTEDGRYVREGKWQIMIHGESFKPIVAEVAKTAIGSENVYRCIFISHLLKDRQDPNRIAGAVGFNVRDPKIYVFYARAVVCATGDATNICWSHAVGEGGVFGAAMPSVLALIITG